MNDFLDVLFDILRVAAIFAIVIVMAWGWTILQ